VPPRIRASPLPSHTLTPLATPTPRSNSLLRRPAVVHRRQACASPVPGPERLAVSAHFRLPRLGGVPVPPGPALLCGSRPRAAERTPAAPRLAVRWDACLPGRLPTLLAAARLACGRWRPPRLRALAPAAAASRHCGVVSTLLTGVAYVHTRTCPSKLNGTLLSIARQRQNSCCNTDHDLKTDFRE
jgi:hypothetical protein